MRKSIELMPLCQQAICFNGLKAAFSRVPQPVQRVVREDIPQQSHTLILQLGCGISPAHSGNAALAR